MAVCPHEQTDRGICLYQGLTWDPFLTSLENQLLENLSSQILYVCKWRQTSKIWKVQSLYTKGGSALFFISLELGEHQSF